MKKRHLYLLLFGLPALLASGIASVAIFGAVAGLAWLFVLGDDPWPAAANHLLVAVFVISCGGLWLALMSVAYRAGKRQEGNRTAPRMPAATALGVTALLLLLAGLHQWSVGNIGPKSSSVLCSDFCQAKGFASSGMPARDRNEPRCSCYDAQGREALKLSMDEVAAEQRK